jgi:hypothetical protein
LRNLHFRYFKNPNDIFENDENIDRVHKFRVHWYFFVEYLLILSGYCVADLLQPITDKMSCHHYSVVHELLGFIYFLIFEFVYHRRVYKGAIGRSNFLQFRETIQFFVGVASCEYEDLFGKCEGMTDDEFKLKQENAVKFYK